jgi:hypothetical protein
MPIEGSVYMVVSYYNAFPITTLPANENYFSIAGRFNRCTGRSCVIYPQVGTIDSQNRMKTPPGKPGAYTAVS